MNNDFSVNIPFLSISFSMGLRLDSGITGVVNLSGKYMWDYVTLV